MKKYSGVHVDLVQLYKLVEVASDFPHSTGKVGLKVLDDGIQVIMKTKKGQNCEFMVSGSASVKDSAYDKEIVVQAKLLRILLRTFASESSVKLVINPKGLGISSASYVAALFPEE